MINELDLYDFGHVGPIVKGKATKMSHLLLNYLIRDSSENGNSYNWLDNLISLFNNLGMSDIYTSKQFPTIKILLENIK